MKPLLEILTSAEDYRSFLGKALGPSAREGRVSYASFARKAGFASRSYPRDVISGRRRITTKTLHAFVRGFGLSGDAKAYFTWLVALNEPEVNTQGLDVAEIREKLTRLKSRLGKRAVDLPANRAEALFRSAQWLEVYASLGTLEEGSDLARICAVTKLPEVTTRRVLEAMCAQGLAQYRAETDVITRSRCTWRSPASARRNTSSSTISSCSGRLAQGSRELRLAGQPLLQLGLLGRRRPRSRLQEGAARAAAPVRRQDREPTGRRAGEARSRLRRLGAGVSAPDGRASCIFVSEGTLMLKQASVSDLIMDRVSRDRNHYVVIAMRRYPRFINRELRDEYLSSLASDRELFEDWLSTKRRTGDHDGAFAKVKFEERFELDEQGFEDLKRLCS